ncbi:hypothetical protein SS50377_22257 [Spironucleus salmonicida]|uniref:Uncharacterized protein n=1 Tax=Spironucleus salmonicida TaxID=348837 RepID=V6LNE5_9EUKA|nr:hypothetical protein SS50377_22257 [Spironucleus salmonicida]|eukprot:EST42249.1 Hypothetical protein SS50377_ee022 [Spironucleus salmonicida]
MIYDHHFKQYVNKLVLSIWDITSFILLIIKVHDLESIVILIDIHLKNQRDQIQSNRFYQYKYQIESNIGPIIYRQHNRNVKSHQFDKQNSVTFAKVDANNAIKHGLDEYRPEESYISQIRLMVEFQTKPDDLSQFNQCPNHYQTKILTELKIELDFKSQLTRLNKMIIQRKSIQFTHD